MAAVVAPMPAGHPFEGTNLDRSRDWPYQDTTRSRSQDGRGKMQFFQDEKNTGARVLSNGRIDIHIDQHKPSIAGLLNQIQRPHINPDQNAEQTAGPEKPFGKDEQFPLHLNLVIQVIGSRGDIQPFVALGRELKAHGHRVRLATHLTFRQFVLDSGLEFFNIGGDPTELMAFMVKNPGLLPGFKSIRSGDIQKRRREMREIFNGCWRSCFEKGDGTHLHQIKEDPWSKALDFRERSFVADAIIANPPSLAHIHCAQRLGIPLHIIFTMPWSPTQSFPHPLANVHSQNLKPTLANFVSYNIVEMMVWEGLGDILNTLRKKTLSLQPLDAGTASNILHRLQVPHTYLWSPSLLPKPPDWADNIDVCGFGFLMSESSYTPPPEIASFLAAGPKPIYIGFGSIVVDNPEKLTRIVFEAVTKTGQRAIVSKGWGNLGADEVPDNILMIGNCPHDWLFRQVSCVIHHGGAGTTAAGLALGRPTIIVPFFGDQPFWGSIVARAGAGPLPVPYKRLNTQNLSDAIQKALETSTRERAQEIAMKMQEESGVRHGVNSFYRNLDPQRCRCSVLPDKPAAWHLKHTDINLSAFAASVLVKSGKVNPDFLVLHRAIEYDTFRDPANPLIAGVQVFVGALIDFVTGFVDTPKEIVSDLVSTVREARQPQPRYDRRTACQAVVASMDQASPADSVESEGTQIDYEVPQIQIENDGQVVEENRGDEITQEDTRDDDSEDRVNELAQVRSIEHKRDLQLSKAKPMSSSLPPSKPPKFVILHAVAAHGSKMSKKLAKFMIRLPADFSLGMSRGFHNAPKIYHDSTVIDPPPVVGFRSGFTAAGKELRDGLYFGITGIGTHPRDGYKKGGVKGLFKGVGKATGGLFLKPTAGLWGLAGYPLSGILREINDSLGRHQKCMIVMGRISQGLEEYRESTAEDREEVFTAWNKIEHDLKKSNKRHHHAG